MDPSRITNEEPLFLALGGQTKKLPLHQTRLGMMAFYQGQHPNSDEHFKTAIGVINSSMGSERGAASNFVPGDADADSGDHTGFCGNGAASADFVMLSSAPLSGVWELSTEGSAYDTVLLVSIGDGCDAASYCDAELPCIDLYLDAGEEILIVTDGYGSS